MDSFDPDETASHEQLMKQLTQWVEANAPHGLTSNDVASTLADTLFEHSPRYHDRDERLFAPVELYRRADDDPATNRVLRETLETLIVDAYGGEYGPDIDREPDAIADSLMNNENLDPAGTFDSMVELAAMADGADEASVELDVLKRLALGRQVLRERGVDFADGGGTEDSGLTVVLDCTAFTDEVVGYAFDQYPYPALSEDEFVDPDVLDQVDARDAVECDYDNKEVRVDKTFYDALDTPTEGNRALMGLARKMQSKRNDLKWEYRHDERTDLPINDPASPTADIATHTEETYQNETDTEQASDTTGLSR